MKVIVHLLEAQYVGNQHTQVVLVYVTSITQREGNRNAYNLSELTIVDGGGSHEYQNVTSLEVWP